MGLAHHGWTVETGRAALLALASRLGKKRLTFGDITAGSKAGECPSDGWVRRRLLRKGKGLAELPAALGLDAEYLMSNKGNTRERISGDTRSWFFSRLCCPPERFHMLASRLAVTNPRSISRKS